MKLVNQAPLVRVALIAAALVGMSVARATEIPVNPPTEGLANDVLAAGLAQAAPGDRVVLRAGEYRLDRPITFPRAGEPGRPITLCAAPGAYVALLGSTRLTGWERHARNIWRVQHPPKHVRGLYEDAERLTHPRPNWSRREDPPLSELKTPGTWTQDDQWLYVWCRASDSPDNHRLEASQNFVMNVNRPWIRVEGLHMLFGQHVVCEITADHCEVVGCEIAHCSNSVDNSYNADFSGCSHSAFRNCRIHDSFYWGDHGSNSHTLSTIDCGDDGPNTVDGCEIFNGGLGVGSKGAVRELVVMNSRIYDQENGIAITGERSSGPGAGKTDRGHYLVWRNRISDCTRGVWISLGTTHGDRVWGNLIERCATGFNMRNVYAIPDRPDLANNIFRANDVAVCLVGERDGDEKISAFVDAGFRARHNLFVDNQTDWRTPLTWSRNLDLSVSQVQTFHALGLEQGSLAAKPRLDQFGHSLPDCPAIDHGAPLSLPDYLLSPAAWDIGLGRGPADGARPERGLTLSIVGSSASIAPGAVVPLRATLANEYTDRSVDLGGQRDLILTFHFRYRGGHRDKQELWRCRVQLPERTLEPGARLDLDHLPGWSTPTNGALGDAFHLRVDTEQWRQGCRLSATGRLVRRDAQTNLALQTLTDLIYSKEVLPVALCGG